VNDVFVVITIKSIQLTWFLFLCDRYHPFLQFIAWVKTMTSYIEKIIIKSIEMLNFFNFICSDFLSPISHMLNFTSN